MFPNRVGKVLLDGVVNPHEYMNGLYITPSIFLYRIVLTAK